MNILTFDVEDWFHILDNESTKTEKDWMKYEYRIEQNMNRILELLYRKKQKATFFSLGWIARKHPNIINSIDSYGHEIGSHSDMHQLAYQQSRLEFRDDLQRSIHSIEDITGKKVKIYRAPGFSLIQKNNWVFEELINEGIEIDCSIFPAKRAHGGYDRFSSDLPLIVDVKGSLIKEFPINLYKIYTQKFIFSGGGYFRLLPYFLIKQMMNKSQYVMTYFHPRDFDINQPIISDLNIIRRFKSYYGIKNCLIKLEKLISDFSFINLDDADSLVDWEKAQIVKI